ncbi:unnamed protein product [Spodoptera littoralis]|uniref:SH3 domain-binding glutamic acid-rich protein n=1 Tax=Spodoptera littoralis TaxID=7109 RepID=A0A9P0IE16_SPOLI|nr:unnamed protein product [Spodoptera littoralis]CAH1644171.1 unnamed protein product [Spodoptera littoralis]
MVVKVYISGISGNKEVKKRQQRVLMILDSKNIKYDVIDITEPGKESDKEFMQNNSKSNGGTVSDPNPRSPLPPQIFNDEEYCGDYDQFDLANEVDTLEQFLKMEAPPEEPPQVENEQEKAVNGDVEAESKESEESTEGKVDAVDTTETAEEEEKSPEKEGSPTKEPSPTREEGEAASKEGSPDKEEDEGAQGDSKEKSPEKETERQKSVEKESTPEAKAQSPEKETVVEAKEASKENSPAKDEVNGTASSREQSEEKDTTEQTETVEAKKDNPSEALIQSEQIAAAE